MGKLDFKMARGLDSAGAISGPLADFCENGDERPCSVKAGNSSSN
jgi:hypothetical protein